MLSPYHQPYQHRSWFRYAPDHVLILTIVIMTNKLKPSSILLQKFRFHHQLKDRKHMLHMTFLHLNPLNVHKKFNLMKQSKVIVEAVCQMPHQFVVALSCSTSSSLRQIPSICRCPQDIMYWTLPSIFFKIQFQQVTYFFVPLSSGFLPENSKHH